MATWKVIGADRHTDARVEIELSAPDEASALLAALLRGVYVARVCRLAGPAATPDGETAARYPAPRPQAPKTPARDPARGAAPHAAPAKVENPVKPAARLPEPARVAADPRRVQVRRRAPADLLPRAFADLLSAPQPPVTGSPTRTPGTRR